MSSLSESHRRPPLVYRYKQNGRTRADFSELVRRNILREKVSPTWRFAFRGPNKKLPYYSSSYRDLFLRYAVAVFDK
jgi:hypothetical protein